ncbi:hypothetical protein AVEN_159642-1 [Araneus ventricosus]|uniref:Uncharacterized protein n=1 Tax=Araneus ventricosus TaxID=182803 RepID=A0A4Y2W6N9_ARAVE|nr:hypothetical protein AVEN_263246-1 [Araneus ventricosus]GBO32201.1 hypothetical protein AVEN_11625-1 [Araneus ventricosus]GBO32214.1 hypothetical protein AVEN_159642-1 [Araneus ventricosus]
MWKFFAELHCWEKLEEVKSVRKNKVTSLRRLKSKVKIGNEDIPLNPETLFRRITLLKKSDIQLQNYFFYELAPHPSSLFNECGMRKSSKYVFYDLFTPITDKINFQDTAYIIDGGFPIHRVIWKNGETFSANLGKYVIYIKNIPIKEPLLSFSMGI